MQDQAATSRQVLVRRIFVAQIVLVAAFCVLAAAGYAWPDRVGSFFFTLLLGCLGASISLFRRSRGASPRMVEDLVRDRISTFMPLLYGGLMAGVAYLLFMSGTLSGDGGKGLLTSNLFPIFKHGGAEGVDPVSVRGFMLMRPDGLENVGRLFVWSFVAGYSESFVTGVLRTLERSATKEPPTA